MRGLYANEAHTIAARDHIVSSHMCYACASSHKLSDL